MFWTYKHHLLVSSYFLDFLQGFLEGIYKGSTGGGVQGSELLSLTKRVHVLIVGLWV